MNLEIDKKILEKFEGDVKVFFYEAGCEGTKVNITDSFEKNGLSFIEILGKNIYFQKKDQEHLDGAKILPKTDTSEHSKGDKYLFISPKVKGRCGCATSFSFEKKLIDKDKLNKLKFAFNK